jgi:hypothetical protein
MKVSDEELLELLRELRRIYPDWRLGQIVCNVAAWARGSDKGAVWDLEDSEFIQTAREHLKRHAGPNWDTASSCSF